VGIPPAGSKLFKLADFGVVYVDAVICHAATC
jgi:hypothetical protein